MSTTSATTITTSDVMMMSSPATVTTESTIMPTTELTTPSTEAITTDLTTAVTTELTTALTAAMTTDVATEFTTLLTTTTTIPTTTTLSPCGYPPSVLNGQASRITSGWAEYSCQSGFEMTGPKTIACIGSTWGSSLPVCSVIDQRPEINVFDSCHDFRPQDYESFLTDWWQYFLAVLLTFIALLLLAFLIWCWCCAANSAKVFPTGSSSYVCCRSCRKYGHRASAHHHSRHEDLHTPPQFYHSTTPGVLDMESGAYLVPVSSNKRSTGQIVSDSPRPTPRGEGRLRFVQVVQEVVDEDKYQKKGRAWMPHSHPIRNINTSTK